MNIQQRVSLQAQKSKENKTKGRELTEEEAKKQDYKEFIHDSLSEHERELVKKYLDKLAPLGSYQEYNVYEILKKYDWNEKLVEELTNGFLRKKEEAGDFEGWTQVKRIEKVPPKAEKEQREDRKNKRYQKSEKTNEQNVNESQGSRPQENQTEEQRSFRRGQNQERRKKNFEHQGEYQEGYYNKDRYYNQKGGRKYYEKNKSPVYGKKGGYEQVEYVKKSTQNEGIAAQGEDQTQKQEENIIQPLEVAKSSHQQKNGSHKNDSEHKPKQIEHKDENHPTQVSAKKSHKENETQRHPVSQQQTPQKTKPHSEITIEPQQLKTPERSHEPVKTQEHTQGSATKSESQQNPTGPSQTGVPQPMINPYMMPMMIPPNVKDMQPIFPFPYIVFPQSNGTCLIQPLYQMMPPPMMSMSQGFSGEQGKIQQTPNVIGQTQALSQGNIQKQGGAYNPFENTQQSTNPFFNFSNEENKKGQTQQSYLSMPYVLPNPAMGNFVAGQQQKAEGTSNLHPSFFQK